MYKKQSLKTEKEHNRKNKKRPKIGYLLKKKNYTKAPLASSHFSCLLEFLKQGFISPQGEGQSPFLVVGGVHGQVVDDISQEMGSLHGAARGVVAQGSEMHMQVVVGGLVVQVDPQLGARHAKTLPYGLLRGETESSALTKPWNGWEGASLDGRKGLKKVKGSWASSQQGKGGSLEGQSSSPPSISVSVGIERGLWLPHFYLSAMGCAIHPYHFPFHPYHSNSLEK